MMPFLAEQRRATHAGGLRREEVLACVVRELKRAQGSFSPDVFLVQIDTAPAVLKDYSRRGVLGRLWGRYVTWREMRALCMVGDLDGVPRFLARVGTCGILMEFVEGELLPRRNVRASVSIEFFERAQELLGRIHSRGVAHGDVRRKNLIIRPNGSPAIIDFQTAWLAGRGFFSGAMFRYMCCVDTWNLLKIKAKSFPRKLRPEERAALEAPPRLLGFGRRLRRWLSRRSRVRRSKA